MIMVNQWSWEINHHGKSIDMGNQLPGKSMLVANHNHLDLNRILSVWGPLPPPGATPTTWNSTSPRLSAPHSAPLAAPLKTFENLKPLKSPSSSTAPASPDSLSQCGKPGLLLQRRSAPCIRWRLNVILQLTLTDPGITINVKVVPGGLTTIIWYYRSQWSDNNNDFSDRGGLTMIMIFDNNNDNNIWQ